MKLGKKDYIYISSIIGIIIAYVLIITRNQFLYGSTIDWDTQHFAIPDYIRTLFYRTHQIIPNFAFNMGMGQNIFNLSYYGFLNPIILISYFLPFLKMVDYIQISSVLIVITSCILFYKWQLNKFDSKTAFLGTLIFLSASPILFHSHRHIMYMNYMPFLIMAMMGVDNYFNDNKKALLIVSVFLIIMTSYFFSVPSLLMITIYGIYKYLEKNKNIKPSIFIKDGFKYISILFIGILMASIILLPTLYVLFNGRTDTSFTIDLFNILKPSMSIRRLFYGEYNPGMTFIFVFALVNYFINGNKEHKFLSVITVLILIIPIFAFILNGTMYIDTKVFIPFIPLFGLMVASTINDLLKNNKNMFKILYITYIIGIIMIIFNTKSRLAPMFIIDVLLLMSSVYLYMKKKNKYILYIALIIPCITLITINLFSDQLYQKDKLQLLENASYNKLIEKALLKETNIYRLINDNSPLQNMNRIHNINHYSSTIYSSTSNDNYKNYYYNYSGNEINQRSYGKISSSKNLFYNMAIGNKYHISNASSMLGYSPLYTMEGNTIYANNNVLPIIYASSNIISKKEVDELSFPYNMDALLRYIVVDSFSNTNHYVTNIKEIYPNYEITEEKNIKIKELNDSYKIISSDGHMKIKVDNLSNNEILIISFKVANNNTCKEKDLTIHINGIKNTLTCSDWKYHNGNYEFKYVISSNDKIKELKIKFSEGIFNISDIKTYIADYNDLKDVKKDVDEMIFDKEKTLGDVIEGTINVRENGFLNMSVPYDKGFKLYIDDKETDYVKTNYDFMGTPISAGVHKIRIEYKAPLLREGLIISAIGFVLLLAALNKDINKNKKKQQKKLA